MEHCLFWSIVLFRKKVYKARKQLAAIDWNYHLDIPEQEDVLGEVAVTRKYNQRLWLYLDASG